MLKLFKFLAILSYTNYCLASGIDTQYSPQGDSRISFSKKDIKIQVTKFKDLEIRAMVDDSSFEWVRVEQTLLIPRVRLKIKVSTPQSELSVHYKDNIFSFQQSKKNSYSEIYYSLFEKNVVKIYQANKLVGQIELHFNDKHKQKRVLIDYTCSRNGIRIDGLEKEHLSIGCHTRPIGRYGQEKPMLEIKWLSPELKIVGSDYVPYQAAFINKKPVRITVLNTRTNQTKEIIIHARVNDRLHRMFTAYGYGAHALHTNKINKTGTVKKKQADIVPALFFYLNYKISDHTSVRGFNAAFFQESKFNNAGLYFGSDFGFALDDRLYFTTLLGVQYLYFKFDDDTAEISEPIFPQGIEFMYRHLFGIENYIVSGGIFVSTTDEIDYENIWVRWGKNYFWELNVITWGKEDFQAKTWGVSVGFPFKGFL
ncbi:MAG: hypothetical protein HON90_14830 [Halobacteriovoraceae bacterium]|nr:hypothetical protein [Halobacteriovoraceae bacterium]